MASQMGAVAPRRKKGFAQTEAMNAQLPYLNQIMAQKQQKSQRIQDVDFRNKQQDFTEKAQKQNLEQQRAQQRAQMGLEASKLGLTVGMSPDASAKNLGSLFNVSPGSQVGDTMSGLNIANTVGSGLVGMGIGSMFKKKGSKFGAGALGGAITGLMGAGAGMGLTGAISGGLMGGLGGLASSLF